MLNKLAIKNFQSHKDTVLELGSGVNTFVGSSNAGKSAIFRSLYLLFKNRPLGTGFIRKGTDEVSVVSDWERDGTEFQVGRRRGKSENVYTLTGYEDFTSPGNNPPEEVLKALNISDINIQKQFSPYFLIFDSPGQIAKYIKSITGLEEVDAIAASLASKLRKKKISISEKSSSLEELLLNIKELENIPLEKLEGFIGKSEKIIVGLKLSEDQLNILRNFSKELELLYSKKIDISEETFSLIQKSIKIVSSRYSKGIFERNSLSPKLKLWEKLVFQTLDISEEEFLEIQRKLQKILKIYAKNKLDQEKLILDVELWGKIENLKIDISLSSEDFGVELINSYKNNCKKLLDLHGRIEEIEAANGYLKGIKKKLKELKNEEENLRSQLKICPVCGLELTEEAKKNLLGN